MNPGEGRRVPLSGSNSGHKTSADALYTNGIYVETKYRAVHTTCTLHRDTRDKARKEGLVPVSCLKEKGRHGFLYVIDSRDLDEVILRLAENRGLINADGKPETESETP